MEYARLVETYRALEATQSTLEKASILADLFQDATGEELELLGHLVMGRAFPAWQDLDIGIGSKLMVKAIAQTTGVATEQVEELWKEHGDLGDAAEILVQEKKQQTLGQKELTVELVQKNLEKIASVQGTGSEQNKIGRIAELVGFASPEEAKYVVRTVLEEMRVGVGEGLVRNAIIEAFFAQLVTPTEFTGKLQDTGKQVAIAEEVHTDVSGYGLWETFVAENEVSHVASSELELEDLWRIKGYDLVVLPDTKEWKQRLEQLVQHAYDVSTDFGVVARTAAEDGVTGLQQMDIELFRPVKVMLAQKAEGLEDGYGAVKDENGVMIAEYKYDGMRVQIHKQGDEVRVFTRRLEDVTKQFPDIVSAVKEHVSADGIIEGEVVAYDPDDGSMVPFQKLSRRIKRKYKIQEMVQRIPVTVYLFDAILLEGEPLLRTPLRDRWAALETHIAPVEQEIELADHIETDDLVAAEQFYQNALQAGQEGVMLKNLEARYTPGSRVGYMVKVKPVMETLDLVIVGADWGEGRRSNWMGSYLLACRDPETGDLETVGKMATGFTDEQLEEMTETLRPLIVEESGREITLKPEVVVEVAYEEIQQSPQYGSGYALRFPRLVQFRDDLDAEEANELGKIERLYEQQRSSQGI